MLVVFLASVLVVPVAAGLIGLYRYRKRTPESERSRREAVLVFLRWAGAAALIGLAIGFVNDLVSSPF